MAPPVSFPLRWESTGNQWWYVSPIDWAAANGHYETVRELLRLDNNNLMKLTSLRRNHRLETVWDDYDNAAKCRSQVAKKLLMECEKEKGKNDLIRRGYGGWLIYTAASAGDFEFVRDLLERDPLLVFGEGEYGVSDILYAGARGKNCDVFWILFNYARSPRFSGGDSEIEIPEAFELEVLNRALHAAARGGNLGILRPLLWGCCRDVFAFRDNLGATILHTAAARGQLEVVKEVVARYNIVNSRDNRGNMALHVAAARGELAVVEALVLASPSSARSTNNDGETYLHSAVSGFERPRFRRLGRQVELMEQLVSREIFGIEDIINVRRNDGRTALHLAVIVHHKLVELLMSVWGVDVNVRDEGGMTPLDVLRMRPSSETTEILAWRLISAGAIFGQDDPEVSRRVFASHLRMQKRDGDSPGTSFGVSDSRMLSLTGIEVSPDRIEDSSEDSAPCSAAENHLRMQKKEGDSPGTSFGVSDSRMLSVTGIEVSPDQIEDSSEDFAPCSAAENHCPMNREHNSERHKKMAHKVPVRNCVDTPITLRETYSKDSSSVPAMAKRSLSVRNSGPKKKRKNSVSRMINGVLTIPRHKDERGRRDSICKCLCFRVSAKSVEEAPSFRYMNALFHQPQAHMHAA